MGAIRKRTCPAKPNRYFDLTQRGKILTSTALAAPRAEHAGTIAPMQQRSAEAAGLEAEVSDLVNQAYGLTADEIALMWGLRRRECRGRVPVTDLRRPL